MRTDPRVQELARRVACGGVVTAEGLWGSSAPLLAALVAQRSRRPLLLVTAHAEDADDYRDDIETLLGRPPELLPQLDSLPGEAFDADELASERLRLCMRLVQGSQTPAGPEAMPIQIVSSVLALMQPVPSEGAIRSRCLHLAVGQNLGPEALVGWLSEHGFLRCDAVDVPGDFARRGGIVDVFSSITTDPVRIEFAGDQIESIRLFEPGTQRSSRAIPAVQIPAMTLPALRSADLRAGLATGFLSLLPEDTLIAVHEPAEVQEIGRTIWERLGEPAGMIPVEALFRSAARFTQLHLHRFASGQADAIDLGVHSLPPFEGRPADALASLRELAAESRVFVLCDNPAEKQRFEELLSQAGLVGGVHTAVGVLHHGFRWADTALLPHHELFGRYRQRRTLRRVAPARPVDSFFDLERGDLVVHALHGIGRFLGLKTLTRTGQPEEYLALEFAGGTVLHVAASQIHLVQKYIGTLRRRPALSKLGGTAWKNAKARAQAAVTDLAAELLAIQAQRETQPGYAYPPDSKWQRDFEDSFPYSETEDQLKTLAEIKADLSRPRPTDRLLCGDVGYGKTELAIRAAFKVAESGKQVAVLVPTTVLAQQHFQTFRERMADYPFVIEMLSRFRSRAEQDHILEQTRRGIVDILIGTHRLLSDDVRFADLGLVIIDEEQRFGVEHKERLKRLRVTVDVLTLTATPIPRTLHMAMLGLRDISSLATPPLDRRAIVTQIRLWDDALIREAILRELNRDGQVYFVHNYVRDIHAVANHLRSLVPEARFVVGHGQMPARELEEVMLRFLGRKADVLVCTNIVESGLDIPTANTIFIDHADHFGLADLHQLRGRVGRSHLRGYAYLLLRPGRPITDAAARRLKAIEHYSNLGAGFQIALRDLEIRGAGNLLGPEQSGHIEAVGYEMYCELLAQAVRRLRNEPVESFQPVNLDLGISAHIPRSYIRSDRQRMEVYRRATTCRRPEELESLREDLRDAFGPLPPEVEILLALAEIRVLARPWGIRSIILQPPDLIFSVDDFQRVQPLFQTGPGSPRLPDPTTIHWRLPKRLLQMPTLLSVLRNQLASVPAPAPRTQKQQTPATESHN